MKLTNHIYLLLRLRTGGALLAHTLYTNLWCASAQGILNFFSDNVEKLNEW